MNIKNLIKFLLKKRNDKAGMFSNLLSRTYSRLICFRYGFYGCTFLKPINLILGFKYIKIGVGSKFGKFLVLTAWDKDFEQRFKPSISIGSGCNFGDFLHLTCINKIKIGNNVLTGRWVTITDNSHGSTDFSDLKIEPLKRKFCSYGAVIIGDNVWIGDKVTILPNVKIGEGVVIGANSVVTKDVPPYCIVVGNPAKIIKRMK